MGTAGLVAAVAWRQARRARGRSIAPVDPKTGGIRAPWSYGAFGRLVVSGLLAWQIGAVVTWLRRLHLVTVPTN